MLMIMGQDPPHRAVGAGGASSGDSLECGSVRRFLSEQSRLPAVGRVPARAPRSVDFGHDCEPTAALAVPACGRGRPDVRSLLGVTREATRPEPDDAGFNRSGELSPATRSGGGTGQLEVLRIAPGLSP